MKTCNWAKICCVYQSRQTYKNGLCEVCQRNNRTKKMRRQDHFEKIFRPDSEIIAAIERGVKRVIEAECAYHLCVTHEQKDLINRTALAIRDELIKD